MLLPAEIDRNMGLLGINTLAATGRTLLLTLKDGQCVPESRQVA
jgi:hypothetical protein